MSTTVLIIDDSETVRQRVQQVLQTSHVAANVLFAKDGLEGFKLLLNNRIDLVLCDVIMPGIDGFKFLSLKKARAELVEVPVIMLAGTAGDVGAKVRGLEAGASDYLTKPFDDEELVARCKVHLKLKALQDELREKNQRLEELSNTDGLTRVVNRRHLMELVDLEFTRARRYNSTLSFIMVDIDHFKNINDHYGHQVGDQALMAVALVLRQDLRRNDVVGRYGGEEFSLLLPETSAEGARVVAERYRKRIEENRLNAEGDVVSITASFGVAELSPDIKNIDALVRRADAAMYQAKHQGRNRVVVAATDGSTERDAIPLMARSLYPRRIVCLTEETTETLYLLGEEERIVGISGFTVRPPRARKEKPKVSVFLEADIPAIEELAPDLVIAFSDLQADIVKALIQRGIEVLCLNHRSVDEILRMVVMVGSIVGKQREAEQLAGSLEARVDAARERATRLPLRPRVFFEEWPDPLISGIRWVSELIEAAGGDDLFAEKRTGKLAKDRIVDPAEVVRRDPQLILGSWCGKKMKRDEVIRRAGFDQTAAVRNDLVFEIKSPIILQPGPAALTDGLDALEKHIHAAVTHYVGQS